jgi:hypothetical protein
VCGGIFQVNCPLCLSDTCRVYFEEKSHLGYRKFWCCEACGVIFLDPALRMNQAEAKKRYDFHRNSPEDPHYRAFLSRLLDPLQKYLPPGACGLDYGCGPGPAIRFIMQARGLEVSNFDPIYFPNEELLDAQYDFITCTEVLEHLGNPRAVFQKLHGMLKAGKSYLSPREVSSRGSPQEEADFLADDAGLPLSSREGRELKTLRPRSYLGIMTDFFQEDCNFEKWHYKEDPTHICFYRPRTFEWVAQWMGWRLDIPRPNVVIFSN